MPDSPEATFRQHLDQVDVKAIADSYQLLEHVSVAGPIELQRDLDKMAFPSSETASQVEGLAAPFLQSRYKGTFSDKIAQFGQALKAIPEDPASSQAAIDGFNKLMNQYGVSLDKQADQWKLTAKNDSTSHEIRFDQQGKPTFTEDISGGSKELPDLTIDGQDPPNTFAAIQMEAIYGATKAADLARGGT